MKAFVRSRSAFLFVSNFPPILHSSPPPRFIHRVSRISLSFSLPKNSFGCHNNRAERIHETVIPALCEDSHRDVYVYPPSLSLPLALYGPLFPCDAAPSLSPPRYRSTPLSGCSPLFVTAVSPLKHCAPSLSLSLPPPLLLLLPHLLLPPVAVDAPSPPCRLRYVSRYDSPSRPSSPILLRVFLDDGSEETVQRPHSFPNWDAYVCAN